MNKTLGFFVSAARSGAKEVSNRLKKVSGFIGIRADTIDVGPRFATLYSGAQVLIFGNWQGADSQRFTGSHCTASTITCPSVPTLEISTQPA